MGSKSKQNHAIDGSTSAASFMHWHTSMSPRHLRWKNWNLHVCKPNSNNQWLCANGFRPADQFKETSSASSKSQCCFHCFVPKHVENPESGKIRPSQHQTVCCPSVMSSELQRMRKLYIQQAWEFFIVFTIPL